MTSGKLAGGARRKWPACKPRDCFVRCNHARCAHNLPGGELHSTATTTMEEPTPSDFAGDLPYSTASQATVGVPNLIADMNRQNLAFARPMDGDLKGGSSACTDAVYTQALAYVSSLPPRPCGSFTPGDNDWTECDRTAGYSSLAQLDKERKRCLQHFRSPWDNIAFVRKCSPRLFASE